MPPLLRFILVIGAMFFAVVAGVTLVATEGPEVVVLGTRMPEGGVRKTRVWIADAEGASWVEAATPEREFYLDIQRNPTVSLERGGETRPYIAKAFPGPEGNAKIRGLLREKYGWADWWLQQIVDTSQSIAIRLDPPPRFMAPRQ